ncbi:MAG TPA: DUF922 domain-containing protein [Polyangiaceae bacterium]|nr:DUF922 domain-containing protein [Polyangiaceae bacterium]
MGGGRLPGPTCVERAGDDPRAQRGFSDPIPLGGGAGSAATVTLAGWPRALTWNDFRDVGSQPAGATEAAQIHSEAVQPERVGIAREGGNLRLSGYTVRVRIVSDDTWVIAGQKGDALLVHEQGHYDIVGLTARDMVTDLGAIRASSAAALQQQVTDVITRAGELAQRLDTQYDGSGKGGTNHGADSAAQGRWNAHLRACRENNTRLAGAP